jgi:hypothetical protein
MKNSVFSIKIWRNSIFFWKILSNLENSQLQAKNTGYLVKNSISFLAYFQYKNVFLIIERRSFWAKETNDQDFGL